MQQQSEKYLMFRNRLEKKFRHLSKQARNQGISCYRIYDHDLPEFPFIIEKYGDRLYVSEYKRNHQMDDVAHEHWLKQSRTLMSEVTGVAPSQIHIKLRKRKAGRQDQYQKLDEEKEEFIVEENGLKFIVNLRDYLDTGLFLDHRITRQMVREISAGKNVLNLFCYTGSFSVYALAGQASSVTSVDLSKTYLDWTTRNISENFPDTHMHQGIHMDVLQYLRGLQADIFDVIVLDPPTFSNSKRMDDILDTQRDHVKMINSCLYALRPGGVLFFSTNYTKFKLDQAAINSQTIRDITKQTTPFDFQDKLKRQCFRITK